jgi:hypothetical protein
MLAEPPSGANAKEERFLFELASEKKEFTTEGTESTEKSKQEAGFKRERAGSYSSLRRLRSE